MTGSSSPSIADRRDEEGDDMVCPGEEDNGANARRVCFFWATDLPGIVSISLVLYSS